MLENYLKKEYIRCNVTAHNREEAIFQALKPMEEDGAVLPSYTQDILLGMKEYGPYFVLVKGVAMPHGRSETGALKDAIGITTLKEPVHFQSVNDPVKILFPLSARENDHHIELISQLATLLEDKALLETLQNAKSEEEIWKCIIGR